MKPSPQSVRKNKIKKLDLLDKFLYVGYRPEAWGLEEDISRSTKVALIEIQVKINEIIERLNNETN